MKEISVCVLLFDDYIQLASRCLTSICFSNHGSALIRDFRIGLNKPSDRVRQFAKSWAELASAEWDAPVLLYEPLLEGPALKYPLMRRMFRDTEHELGEHVMWFDDDSFVTADPGWCWWAQVREEMSDCDMLGQQWRSPIRGNQWAWIQTQPWFNPAARPAKEFVFCTGGWWCIRSRILKLFDWPIPELRHSGGDSLLGELFRHQNLHMKRFDFGVRINADAQGMHSRSPRRGYSEPPLGECYDGTRIDTSHQNFAVRKSVVLSGAS